METLQPEYTVRRQAIYQAWGIIRATDRKAHMRRKKILNDNLAMEYVNAIAMIPDSCIARMESEADKLVSSHHGWETMEEQRNREFEVFKASLAS